MSKHICKYFLMVDGVRVCSQCGEPSPVQPEGKAVRKEEGNIEDKAVRPIELGVQEKVSGVDYPTESTRVKRQHKGR